MTLARGSIITEAKLAGFEFRDNLAYNCKIYRKGSKGYLTEHSKEMLQSNCSF